MSHSSRIGFVVFGLGRAGVIHSTNLIRNPQATLKWIVDIDEDKAKKFVTENFMDTQVIAPSDMDKALLDPTVQAAVVATPTKMHEDIVMRCLRAGKAVFCEKPIAPTLQAIEHCYKEADNQHLPLLCAFNRRFDPTVRSVFDRVRKDDIGNIQVVKTTSRDSAPPSEGYIRISGGIFHDSCVHDVDLLCWMLGEAPHTVFCLAHAFHAHIGAMNDVDTVGVVMKFPSGAIGQIDMSRHAVYGYDQRVEVFGSGGMLTSDNQSSLCATYFHASGSTQNPIKVSFPQRYSQAYELEMNHFIDVIKHKDNLLISKDDVLRSFTVVEAIEKSFRTGKPVSL
ncbi:myo-inositol 2-dehydrogenase-like [Pocillopora verrucosa]|uniref:myo-inositol 2-dehydrogenase-like n=1 Tax=Pocillopora verrucosa TaxID=203993 RepID=UPI0027978622|nr:myo-inositol 2-dehydrogenase-like [Pocillopora verrucosa]XP_058954180.1 myo-inositol 2-dehydrogenase-like [Pocillopora verrucosa]